MIANSIRNFTSMNKKDISEKLINRNITLDILRIIACFLVIVCHTYTWGFNKEEYNFVWFLSVAICLVSKTAVPIFFMISGYLNLKKDYTYKEIIKKTFTRILIPLLLFSALIYFKNHREISIENFYEFIIAFLQEDIMQHYWFLYALIGMYLITPIIRKMLKNFEEKDYKYFILIWVISLCIIPLLEKFLHINIINRIPVITGYVGYYILGYYIFSKKMGTLKNCLLINILSLLFIVIISTIITYLDCNNSNNYNIFLTQLNYLSIMIPTVNIVNIVRCIFENKIKKSKIKRLIIAISSTTFGIYLIHGVLLGKFKLLFDFMSIYMPDFIATISTQVIMFVIISTFIYCIKKIPIIRNIL